MLASLEGFKYLDTCLNIAVTFASMTATDLCSKQTKSNTNSCLTAHSVSTAVLLHYVFICCCLLAIDKVPFDVQYTICSLTQADGQPAVLFMVFVHT